MKRKRLRWSGQHKAGTVSSSQAFPNQMGKLVKFSIFVAVVAVLVFVGMRATETSSLFGRVRLFVFFSPSLSPFPFLHCSQYCARVFRNGGCFS
jgi:hypothetical protein